MARQSRLPKPTTGPTVADLQHRVDEWIGSIRVRYFIELTNMAILTEEVGELARIMARTYGEQSFKMGEKKSDAGEEMADVLFVLLCLANQCDVDLAGAFEKKMKARTKRDKSRHKKNRKLRA